MRLNLGLCLSLGLTVTASLTAAGRGADAAGQMDHHAVLWGNLNTMSGRLNGPRASSAQVIADAQLLSTGYRSLVPYVGSFSAAERARNREVARRSLDWLYRASVLYGRDPLVAQAFLSSYDSIGGFYRDSGPFYRPGAYVAYAGGSRLARRLIYDRRDPDRYEREMERFALAYGTLAAYNGAFWTPWMTPQDLPDAAPPQDMEPSIPPKPVALPPVDVAKLTAAQKAAWTETRDRFRIVAANVHGAVVLLNQLSGRLRSQGMDLHPTDAANALKMQGFLDDAVDLVREGRFDTALEALTRADYVRAKLKSVTGQ